MALDSIYKVKEVKKSIEVKPQYNIKDIKRRIESLPAKDIDQQWVKENEGRDNRLSTTNQRNEVEQQLDDIIANLDDALAKFKKTREVNNKIRSQSRKQQLTLLQQFEELERKANSLSGGKSR